MDEIIFEKPKPARAGRTSTKWLDALLPLIERPNEWARVKTTPTKQRAYALASELKRGVLRKPPGRWDFAGREAEDGKRGYVFACYLGSDEDA